MPIELPFVVPMWANYALYGLEFVIALIAAIRFFRSEQKIIAVSLLIIMIIPISYGLAQLRVIGLSIVNLAEHILLIVGLFLIVFGKKKKGEKDEFSL